MEHYPAWLYRSIVESDLPWESAKELTFAEFSDRYTLHDSYWIGLFYDVAYENDVVLAIVWDAVWLPDELAESTSLVDDWPLLFIKVENASQISTTGYDAIESTQRGIGTAEIEKIGSKHLLIISDHYGGNVEIVFEGKMNFLALNRNKEIIHI